MIKTTEKLIKTTNVSKTMSMGVINTGATSCAALRELGITGMGLHTFCPPFLMVRGALMEELHYIVFCIFRGEVLLETRKEDIALKGGEMVVIPSNIDRRLVSLSDEPFAHVHFKIPGTAVQHYLKSEHVCRQSVFFPEKMEFLCCELAFEQRSQDRAAERAATGYAELLSIILVREMQRLKDSAEDEYSFRFSQLWEEVNKKLSYPWNVESLAHQIHVSPSHLYALCKKHFGITPMQYVTKLRMEHAKLLLITTEYNHISIAMDVGYGSEPAFSATFYKHTGCRPGAYRKQNK